MINIASISGGKDSTALWLLAIERGVDVKPVFADTGHEHRETYEYLDYLESTLGPIHRVKNDFTKQIKHKIDVVNTKWRKEGVPEKIIENAIEALKPTGNPFLDLCVWKGRFPSTRVRFCSSELKHAPIRDWIEPWLIDGETIISWQGVRADESRSRNKLDIVDEPEPGLITYRPLILWTANDVFDMHKKHNVKWNPLYNQGMGRVGCMPCIHATKQEIKEIARRWPEVIDRIEQWEAAVAAASKHQKSTFFSYDKTPGAHRADTSLPMPGIREVVDWSGTKRGGRQYVFDFDPLTTECSSIYGLCETAR